MWDTPKLSAGGNFYLRKIALLIVAGLMSAIFVALLNSHPTYAANASWQGSSISYNGNTYNKLPGTPALPGLDPSYTQVYSYQNAGKAYVVALKDGEDSTKQITDAEAVTYDYDGSNYSNPDPPTGGIITVDASGANGANSTDANGNNTDKNTQQTSCGVKSIGWILCGISRFFAGAMDKAYDWINNFLVVKPLSTDTTSGLYQAWNIARSLANLCFIVAFLAIVYAQITSMGISNYEIKKMIPKLIVAAILVNVSYYICAFAVDLSNILGDSVQKALVEIRNSLPAPKAQTDWSSLTDIILSGGTVVAAGAAGIAAIGSGTGFLALVPLLVPILISGVLSVLVALLVLAGRQALITVLVILSPLAFVAFLLPNTEKLFDRWRGIFMNMLLIFPMFSLLFGGSQLAAYLIIQNTDQISVVILAMFVQVAPLAITPFLMRFSHSLLQKLGDFANNPRKGLVDRSRNFAKDRSEKLAERHRANGANSTRRWGTSRMAYKRASGKVLRENRMKLHQAQVVAAAMNEERAKNIVAQQKAADLKKNAGEAMGETLFEKNKAESSALLRDSGNLRLAQQQSKALQSADEARWHEAQTELISGGSNHRYAGFSDAVKEAHLEQRIADSNAAIAQSMHNLEYSQELDHHEDLQLRAGGIDPMGKIKVKSKASSDVINASAEDVKMIKTASPIDPGDIEGLDREFRKAIKAQDHASMRAYADLLIDSQDPGIRKLRAAITDNETDIRSNHDAVTIFRNHLNSHQGLNASAEDIAVWSRDAGNAWRQLADIQKDAGTWNNLTNVKFAGMKASTQLEALQTKDASGNWAITEETAKAILESPMTRGQIKPKVRPVLEERAGMRLNIRGT